MMLSVLQHPVLGKLVPDQWGDELVTFRQFPHMRPFWHPARDELELEPEHRKYVEDYQNHIEELAPICRNGDVHSALQSLGVYELSVQTNEPSIAAQQVAAYEYFSANEQVVCQNIVNAAVRYYHVARQRMEDWFDDDDEYPDALTEKTIGGVISFDGFSIRQCSADGVAPLRLAWAPDWDPEHGLLMAVYKDQVLAIGSDDVDDFLSDPAEESEYAIWTTEDMTPAERAMRQQFVDQFEPADE